MWKSWIQSSVGSFAPEADDVVRWRRRRLLRAGFDVELALALASHSSVDVHALIELVEHGCPPHLAARILAPIEAEGEAC